jgi:hypothetical protein
LVLKKSDIRVIASLPYLENLWIGNCSIADGAFADLVRCRGLQIFRICDIYSDYTSVFATIGRNLSSLELWDATCGLAAFIVEHCPNIQYLDLRGLDEEDGDMALLVGTIKNGLKKLAKIEVDRESIRLK